MNIPEIPDTLPPVESWIDTTLETQYQYWVQDGRGTFLTDIPEHDQKVVGCHITETVSGTVPGAHPDHGEVTWSSADPVSTNVTFTAERDEFSS